MSILVAMLNWFLISNRSLNHSNWSERKAKASPWKWMTATEERQADRSDVEDGNDSHQDQRQRWTDRNERTRMIFPSIDDSSLKCDIQEKILGRNSSPWKSFTESTKEKQRSVLLTIFDDGQPNRAIRLEESIDMGDVNDHPPTIRSVLWSISTSTMWRSWDTDTSFIPECSSSCRGEEEGHFKSSSSREKLFLVFIFNQENGNDQTEDEKSPGNHWSFRPMKWWRKDEEQTQISLISVLQFSQRREIHRDMSSLIQWDPEKSLRSGLVGWSSRNGRRTQDESEQKSTSSRHRRSLRGKCPAGGGAIWLHKSARCKTIIEKAPGLLVWEVSAEEKNGWSDIQSFDRQTNWKGNEELGQIDLIFNPSFHSANVPGEWIIEMGQTITSLLFSTLRDLLKDDQIQRQTNCSIISLGPQWKRKPNQFSHCWSSSSRSKTFSWSSVNRERADGDFLPKEKEVLIVIDRWQLLIPLPPSQSTWWTLQHLTERNEKESREWSHRFIDLLWHHSKDENIRQEVSNLFLIQLELSDLQSCRLAWWCRSDLHRSMFKDVGVDLCCARTSRMKITHQAEWMDTDRNFTSILSSFVLWSNFHCSSICSIVQYQCEQLKSLCDSRAKREKDAEWSDWRKEKRSSTFFLRLITIQHWNCDTQSPNLIKNGLGAMDRRERLFPSLVGKFSLVSVDLLSVSFKRRFVDLRKRFFESTRNPRRQSSRDFCSPNLTDENQLSDEQKEQNSSSHRPESTRIDRQSLLNKEDRKSLTKDLSLLSILRIQTNIITGSWSRIGRWKEGRSSYLIIIHAGERGRRTEEPMFLQLTSEKGSALCWSSPHSPRQTIETSKQQRRGFLLFSR